MVMIVLGVWCRGGNTIRIRVRVGIMFNVRVFHLSNFLGSKYCTFEIQYKINGLKVLLKVLHMVKKITGSERTLVFCQEHLTSILCN